MLDGLMGLARVAIPVIALLFTIAWWWRTRSTADTLKAAGVAIIAVTVAAYWNP